MDPTIVTMIFFLIVCFLICIVKSIWAAYMNQFTHKCDIDVISRLTDRTYKVVKWREYKGSFNLYIYNFYTQRFEWKSIFQFKDVEKIIKKLTDGQK